MNPAEIYDALAALATNPYDPVEFPFDFAAATDNNPATIAKLRNGSFNKSDLNGGVLMNQKFHFAPALTGMTSVTLEALRANKRTLKHKPAILIATDGVEVSAEHPKSGGTLHCAYSELGDRFGFFLPAAGKERYRAAEENPVDVKVAGKLAKLYDALIRRNPDWAAEDRRHDMNQLMTRLIFCLFAEDVGIFPDNQFSRLIFTHAGDKGEGMGEVLISAFTAMNTPRGKRDALPAWTREFEYVNGGLFAGAVDAANIVCDNALRVNWERVCPVPEDGGEVFIAGNPPFLGKAQQDADQKADKDIVFSVVTSKYKAFDYVVGWFYKAGQYIKGRNARAAFVSTNSIVQGAAVSTVWPLVLGDTREMFFAHRTLKWRNNASDNAAVMFVIVGIRNQSAGPKTLIDGDLSFTAANINAYLLDAPDVFVEPERESMFGLPEMLFGNMPRDGGHLILDEDDRASLLADGYGDFVKAYMGSEEVVKGFKRYCLWISLDRLIEARRHPIIDRRLSCVTEMRASSDAESTRQFAASPHRFVQIQGVAQHHAILVPSVTSERRPYLPFDRVGADTIASNLNFALYDAPDWCMALIASRLHIVWIGTVCGKLKSDFRYSNTLGWNTFPVPKFTEDQLAALKKSAMAILRCRLTHHPKTIADLYDPDKMPDDLRAAHKANDDLLEGMYIGRPFRNDTERLEHLFKLYAARVKKLKKGAA